MQSELQDLFLNKKPTKQKVFDYVVSKIVQQGQPSISQNNCPAYRGPNDLRCAAGWVLPDEAYVAEINHKKISSCIFQSTVKRHQAYWLKRNSRYFRIIRYLQSCHDEAVEAVVKESTGKNEKFVQNFIALANIEAKFYKLKPFVQEEHHAS